jgi:5-methylcytosine-specific restriction endonuclease McrA
MTTRRRLNAKDRLAVFMKTNGHCHFCQGRINATIEAWEVSHEIPLELGGDDDFDNMLPAHAKCHLRHTAEVDAQAIAKSRRVRAKAAGLKKTSRPLPGSRASGLRKRMNGTVERW